MSGGGARRAVGAGEGEPERGGENQKKHLRSPPRRFLDKNPPQCYSFLLNGIVAKKLAHKTWAKNGGGGEGGGGNVGVSAGLSCVPQ